MSDLSEKELVEGVIVRDQRATNNFVRQYQKFVYAIAFRYLKDSFEADDAAQEVLVKAIEKMGKFRGEASLKTWLYTITSNHVRNLLRKKKLKTFFSIGDDQSFIQLESREKDPHNKMVNTQLAIKIQEALDSLPEKQRETFILRYYDEMSYEEISKILGTSIGGLKANYYHATKKMAQFLKDQK